MGAAGGGAPTTRPRGPTPTGWTSFAVAARLGSRRSRPRSPPLDPAVLVVTHDLALGGGQLYLHELVPPVARRGVRFALASPRSGVLTDELEAWAIPVLVTGETQVRDPEAYETQVLAIASWAAEHGCRSAIANTVTAFTGVDAALRLGLPVDWAIHESYPVRPVLDGGLRRRASRTTTSSSAPGPAWAARPGWSSRRTRRCASTSRCSPRVPASSCPTASTSLRSSEYREEVDRDELRADARHRPADPGAALHGHHRATKGPAEPGAGLRRLATAAGLGLRADLRRRDRGRPVRRGAAEPRRRSRRRADPDRAGPARHPPLVPRLRRARLCLGRRVPARGRCSR